ncbi:MAG: protein-L-isoaspartate(D-aspartate) O-methyltransferase [Gammaproteobacteria bacterium]|nr:protein-L-isoaspartate(D-aspartate) O-methyltransferase [Gammaproteobacteria bacterium]
MQRLLVASFVLLSLGLGADTQKMLEDISELTRLTEQYTNIAEIDDDVMKVLGKIDRAKFVPDFLEADAFRNQPLPIGHGQTISQPFIVALMTHLLDVQESDRVLEIGTGSGYQAAVLAELAKDVFTIEIVPELAKSAEKLLENLRYENIAVKVGDGWYGWPDAAPFDKIMVTAVAKEIPPKLVEQLNIEGLIVMPVGNPEGNQDLMLATKREDGTLNSQSVLPVQFVPLTGKGVLTIRSKDTKGDE